MLVCYDPGRGIKDQNTPSPDGREEDWARTRSNQRSNGGRWCLMTLFEILIYFIFIVKAFFASSNAPAYTFSRCNGGRRRLMTL